MSLLMEVNGQQNESTAFAGLSMATEQAPAVHIYFGSNINSSRAPDGVSGFTMISKSRWEKVNAVFLRVLLAT